MPGYRIFVDDKPPKKGDDVVVLVATDGGTKGYVKGLVSIDRKTIKLFQFNPKKTLTIQRKDVLKVRRVGGWFNNVWRRQQGTPAAALLDRPAFPLA